MITKQMKNCFQPAMHIGYQPSDFEIAAFLSMFIPEYEQSKWIRFDHDDESTWPNEGQVVVTDEGCATFYKKSAWTGEQQPWFEVLNNGVFYESHTARDWQPLPQSPKGGE